MGRAAMVTPDFMRPGATVIDVGINRISDAAQAENFFANFPSASPPSAKKGTALVGDVHPGRRHRCRRHHTGSRRSGSAHHRHAHEQHASRPRALRRGSRASASAPAAAAVRTLMLRVGLTGGIASGKSTVACMLRDLDCPVLDADTLGHELLEQGQDAYNEVVREFGKEILDAYGNVDRGKLGPIVFADAQKRARLNQILHPRILDVVRKWFAALDQIGGPELAVLEAALIIEAGYNKELDRVIVCWCPPEQQMRTAEGARPDAPSKRKLRIAAQMPMEEKRRLADEAIDCSGSIEETERQVAAAVQRMLRPAPAGGNIS